MLYVNGVAIFTKRENSIRFDRYSGFLKCVRCFNDKATNRLMTVNHLREGDGARAERAAIGQGEYDPALDIDRYLVDCVCPEGKIEGCAVFNAISRAIEIERLKAVGDKLDGSERKRSSLIRGGDGYMGAIASKVDEEFDFLPKEPELESICKGCEYRRASCVDERTDGNHGCHKEIEVPDKKFSHGGIIAFFKRLIGRRK